MIPDTQIRFLRTLIAGLENMLATGNHADTTIVVDGRVFPCHKVVLCALSPYFEAMFSTDMIESRGGIVTLYDIEPDVFDCLLRFMYTGDNVVNHDNAEKIFRASSMLQIPCLQEQCEEFLLTQVSRDNCIGIWKIARLHNCSNLGEISLMMVLENFDEISSSEDFMTLEIEELINIISSDTLQCKTEESVCDAVMAWIKHDQSKRQPHLRELMGALRLPHVSPDYLFKILQDECFDAFTCASPIMQETFKYHACPAKHSEFSSRRFLQRKHSTMNDCLIIIGGLLKTIPRFQTTKEVICYSFQQEQWYYLPSLPYDPGYEFAVCEHGSNIYLSGGWLKMQGLMVYKGGKNKWKSCPTMHQSRCGHCMVALAGALYVMGGRDGSSPALTSIESFDLRTRKWSVAGELLLGVRSMSVAVVGEDIFVFGGIMENDRDTARVQCFDTRTATSTVIGELPFSCRLTRTVHCDNHVYIVLPDGRIVYLDPANTRKRIQSISELSFSFDAEEDVPDSTTTERSSPALPSPTTPKAPPSVLSEKTDSMGKVIGRVSAFNQHHFESVQHRGNLLLAGGKTHDNTILKRIILVDPTTMKVQSEIQMPAARWCFGFSKIVIEKSLLSNAIGAV